MSDGTTNFNAAFFALSHAQTTLELRGRDTNREGQLDNLRQSDIPRFPGVFNEIVDEPCLSGALIVPAEIPRGSRRLSGTVI